MVVDVLIKESDVLSSLTSALPSIWTSCHQSTPVSMADLFQGNIYLRYLGYR